MGKRIVLASASPRRRELLKLITQDFDCIVSNCDETLPQNISPSEAVIMLSKIKAMAVARELNSPALIIGSDTVVSLDGIILGKPADENDALCMLKKLSAKTHSVFTGVSIVDECEIVLKSFAVETKVTFNELTEEEILDYIATGEPMDKAGAYGIQGLAGKFISGINGDYYNVVGLPVSALYECLKELS